MLGAVSSFFLLNHALIPELSATVFPESPRWMVTHGLADEANRIVVVCATHTQ
jgi:hypothetical protein